MAPPEGSQKERKHTFTVDERLKILLQQVKPVTAQLSHAFISLMVLPGYSLAKTSITTQLPLLRQWSPPTLLCIHIKEHNLLPRRRYRLWRKQCNWTSVDISGLSPVQANRICSGMLYRQIYVLAPAEEKCLKS